MFYLHKIIFIQGLTSWIKIKFFTNEIKKRFIIRKEEQQNFITSDIS